MGTWKRMMQENAGMRICIPTVNAREQFSKVCDQFGGVPYFVIYDSEADFCENACRSHRCL